MMIGIKLIPVYIILFNLVLVHNPARARIRLKDSSVYEISIAVSTNRYGDAIALSQKIVDSDTANPVGYFLLGAVYQNLSEEYRNDSFNEKIDYYLTEAIERSNQMKDIEPDNPELYFISGAALGYRAIHRAFHGHWFKAFGDGLKCSSHLNKSLELDSTYYDAHWGKGAYLYYRTIKAKDFLWLPFVSDRREEGMAMIRKAIAHGNLARQLAHESFLRIYWTEERNGDLLSLADSLYTGLPDDPYILIYYVEGLLAQGRLDEAEEKLMELKAAWKNSPYYDDAGVMEGEYLMARLAYQKGDIEMAEKILEYIIDREDLRDTNAYFAETYDKAKDFRKKIR